jgi:regulation of enolase protein 1 (concanavalin A-like superfamily)
MILKERHMKRCRLYLLLGILIMLPMETSHAQTLPCTPNEVTAGFAQAAQSGTLEMWATSYVQGDCPANIKNGASAMTAAYLAMTATVIPFANPSDPSALNPVFGWSPGGAAGNGYDLTLYPGELALIADAQSSGGNAPALIYPFQGNFQVSVRLDFQNNGPPHQGAGMGLQAADNRVVIISRSHQDHNGIRYSEIYSESSGEELGRAAYLSNIVHLRITRRGTLFSTEYSDNGINWVTHINNHVHSLPDNVEVFLYAYSDNNEGIIARFSEFNIVVR